MTIAALTETRVQISGNGVTKTVAIPFQFIDQNDLKVIHTNALGVDKEWTYQQSPGSWSFTGGNYGTGTLNFTAADCGSGERLTVVLVSRYDQPQTLEGGEIDPNVLQRSMDRTALQVQAIAGEVQRSLSISPSLAGALPNLEVPDLKDGEGFIRQGNGLVPALIDSTAISSAVTASGQARDAAQAAQQAAEKAKADAVAALDAKYDKTGGTITGSLETTLNVVAGGDVYSNNGWVRSKAPTAASNVHFELLDNLGTRRAITYWDNASDHLHVQNWNNGAGTGQKITIGVNDIFLSSRPKVGSETLAYQSEVAAKLDKSSSTITDWNAATQNGFYKSVTGATNTPEGAGASSFFWHGFVSAFDANTFMQTLSKVTGGDETTTEVWQRRGYYTGSLAFSAWVQIDRNANDARYLRRSAGELSFVEYGPVLNDAGEAANNTVKLNSMIADLPSDGGIIHIGPGVHYITGGGVNQITDKNITIRGSGKGVTILRVVGTGGLVWHIVQNAQDKVTHISDMSFEKHTDSTAADGAISITYPTTLSGIKDTVTLMNLECTGAENTVQFAALVSLIDPWGITITNCVFEGIDGQTTAVGLVNVAGKSTSIRIDNCRCYWANQLMYQAAEKASEGLYMSHCHAVACGYLFNGEYANSAPGYQFTACHAETFLGGIRLVDRAQVMITGCLFYKRLTSSHNWAAIELLDNKAQTGVSLYTSITNSQVFGFKGQTSGGTATALNATSSRVIMGDLYVNGCDVGVNFNSSADGDVSLRYYNVTTPSTNLPTTATVTTRLMQT